MNLIEAGDLIFSPGVETPDREFVSLLMVFGINPKRSTAAHANGLISVSEACARSGEKPATIIGWCVRHKIGGHVKTGGGGAWLVDPERLERLLAELAAVAS